MASPELLEWCRRGGVQVLGVEAGFVAEGWRGVIATQDLEPGKCVLRVPRRLLMSVESARRDPDLVAALRQCEARGGTLSSQQVLATHLLKECAAGEASFWHPYLRSLPCSYTTAMCFTAAEAEALQVPAAAAAVRVAAAEAAAQHAAALPLLRVLGLWPKWCSRGAWLWAASTLSSRTMFLPFDAAGALTPFGDLHNYRPPPPPVVPCLTNLKAAAAALEAASQAAAAAAGPSTGQATAAAAAAAAAEAAGAAGAAANEGQGSEEDASSGSIAGDGRLDEAADEYCIYARARYRSGEQLFLCYGRHTNLELLLHYGFVCENPHDTARLPARLLPPAVQQQLSGDDGAGHWEGSAEVEVEGCYLHASGAPSWDLLRALRLGCATLAERKASAYLALDDRPVSATSERGAFQALRAACAAALAELPTTVQQDEAELAELRRAGAAAAEQASAAARQEQAAPAAEGAARQAAEQRRQQQAAERLAVAVEWRLCHKRILQQGMALCDAVLSVLPGAPPPAPDIGARIAAMQRRPRW